MDSPDSKIIRICYLPESSSWVNIAWKWTIYGHNLTLADLQKQYANGNIEFNGTGADTEEGRQDLLERAAIGLSTAKRGLPAPPQRPPLQRRRRRRRTNLIPEELLERRRRRIK